jgi:hypothetical protein
MWSLMARRVTFSQGLSLATSLLTMATRVVRGPQGWTTVTLPVGLDPLWRDSDCWIYAAAYAAAVGRGVSPVRAIVLAEAIVCKRLYEGLVYDKALEEEISRVYC